MNPRVIFVGTGPVGLMTAIQIKLYNPTLPLLMLKKYSEYENKTSVLLTESAFSYTHPDKSFQQLLQSLPRLIQVNELEAELTKLAEKLNIIIESTIATDPAELAKRYRGTEIIVETDGSNQLFKKSEDNARISPAFKLVNDQLFVKFEFDKIWMSTGRLAANMNYYPDINISILRGTHTALAIDKKTNFKYDENKVKAEILANEGVHESQDDSMMSGQLNATCQPSDLDQANSIEKMPTNSVAKMQDQSRKPTRLISLFNKPIAHSDERTSAVVTETNPTPGCTIS